MYELRLDGRCRCFRFAIFLNAAWVPSHAIAAYPAPKAPASETIHNRRCRHRVVRREPVGDAAHLVDARQAALFRQCLRRSRGKPQGARGRRRDGGGPTRTAGTTSEVRDILDRQRETRMVGLGFPPQLLARPPSPSEVICALKGSQSGV